MFIEKAKNLWILTEERPKTKVLNHILNKFTIDNRFSAFVDNLRILPVLKDGKFAFIYEVSGFRCNRVSKVYIKTVSGNSSFVDFLVFYQNAEPDPATDVPDYAVEETKTDDSESRNTSVYQRLIKFIFIDHYYPKTKKIMLYNLRVKQKKKPTDTNNFGSRLMLNMGIEIMGKEINPSLRPFCSVDELIAAKNGVRQAPSHSTSIRMAEFADRIEISGKLKNDKSLSDPTVGTLSAISAVVRKLNCTKPITIIRHELTKSVGKNNKFNVVSNLLDIRLAGLVRLAAEPKAEYWRYENKSEKIGTIFLHIIVSSFTANSSIYENHAGGERGYFITSSEEHITVDKYEDRTGYKSGDKSKIINLPDLTLLDRERKEAINIEGEKYENKLKGIRQIGSFDAFEDLYVKKYYPNFSIIRTVVLYGGNDVDERFEVEVGFVLKCKERPLKRSLSWNKKLKLRLLIPPLNSLSNHFLSLIRTLKAFNLCASRLL